MRRKSALSPRTIAVFASVFPCPWRRRRAPVEQRLARGIFRIYGCLKTPWPCEYSTLKKFITQTPPWPPYITAIWGKHGEDDHESPGKTFVMVPVSGRQRLRGAAFNCRGC